MKKLLYIALSDKSELGVMKKILSQSHAFSKKGYEVTNSYFDGDNYYIGDRKVKNIKKNIFYKIYSRFLFPSFLYKEVKDIEWDVIYIRKPIISFGFLHFLKKLKSKNCKIILEIPTYPYDAEFTQLSKKILFSIERICRQLLRQKIDLITYFGSGQSFIWGVPAIELQNGVDLDNIKVNQPRIRQNTINFIAVGKLASWHGYDRFIKALAKLPEATKQMVRLDIVGNGTVETELTELVRELNIQDIVNFHGSKDNEALDLVFERAHIGVGCLATFRKGMNAATSLKLREYCARGIPFFYSEYDPQFEKFAFKLKVAHDESDLDIESIIHWYNGLTFAPEDIRSYAESKLSWDRQVDKILTIIESDN